MDDRFPDEAGPIDEPDWKPPARVESHSAPVLRCVRCRTAMSVIRVSDACGRCLTDDLRASRYLPS